MNRAAPALRVFIVEDAAALQRALAEVLSTVPDVGVVGYAASAPEAIIGIDLLQPDLVTIDLWLAAGTGFDVMKWLQRRPAKARPVYVALTSRVDPTHAADARRYGAAEVFDKCLHVPNLLALATSMVRAKRGSESTAAPPAAAKA